MSGPARIPATLTDDWVTIWQSEMAALAADRETAEQARIMLDAWFAATAAMRWHDGKPCSSPSGPDAAARPEAAAAASDAGDAIARLEQRLAELERRLDAGLAG